jgi:hypothetical protein
MKKISAVLLIIFMSCGGNSNSGSNTDTSVDTGNTVNQTTDTTQEQTGPDGYSPPNTKREDSSAKEDSGK